jgi:cytochrome c
MDSFELNKIAGAILGTGVFAMGLGVISDILFEQEPPEKPGYVIEVAEAAPTAAGQEAPKAVPLPELLAKADVAKGESISKKCTACHSLEKGGPNKIGPGLWGVVDRPIAAHEGFAYSEGMKSYAATAKTWTFDNLNHFLTNPKAAVAGTAMSFAGVKNDQDRADLLAYLRTLADSPVPLPTVEAAAPAGEKPETEKPAESGAAPAADAPKPEAPAEAPKP